MRMSCTTLKVPADLCFTDVLTWRSLITHGMLGIRQAGPGCFVAARTEEELTEALRTAQRLPQGHCRPFLDSDPALQRTGGGGTVELWNW